MHAYRLPPSYLASLMGSWLALRPRSFAHDARRTMAGLAPAPTVLGAEHVPRQGPCLVTCNHYTHPGFAAWWLTLAVTAAVAAQRAPRADPEIHWVMTAAWTFPTSSWRRRVLTPVTEWAFARVARMYGFVTMPPMPPDPGQVEARAIAVLRTVRLGRRLVQEGGMLGLAPEGRDVPGDVSVGVPVGVGEPPPGVGEFIALLVKMGFPVLPVGVGEQGGELRISFGAPFVPDIPPDRSERDGVVAHQVMDAIARQMPPRT
jgi:1-acyl-sn-glycerol-3-phosphate acyltransferase